MTDTVSMLSTAPVSMGGIYRIPGEEVVVELHQEGKTVMYDKQGLQYRILQRQQSGLDTQCEQMALRHINNLGAGI